MEYVALICARGGSKGLAGKNIRPLCGIPLIGWSIQVARKIERIKKIVVSTDSEEIAAIAQEFGAEVPFLRPAELAQDNSAEWLVWRHALDYLDVQGVLIDGLVSLPPTAPLRSGNDVNRCLDEYEKGSVDVVITVSEAHRNPYFNMTTNDEQGYSKLVISPQGNVFRRQDAPTVYDVTTVAYVANSEYVKKSNGIFEGRVRSVIVPKERAVDIDTLLDFKIAEFILEDKKGSDEND